MVNGKIAGTGFARLWPSARAVSDDRALPAAKLRLTPGLKEVNNWIFGGLQVVGRHTLHIAGRMIYYLADLPLIDSSFFQR